MSRPRWKKRLREREQIYLRQIEDERARSDRLLLNILPHPIATRLKNGEQWVVNSFEEVTVLFPDLVGFTSLATQTAPSALIQLLDQVLSAFDELADLHGVEKIKTTGDAYRPRPVCRFRIGITPLRRRECPWACSRA